MTDSQPPGSAEPAPAAVPEPLPPPPTGPYPLPPAAAMPDLSWGKPQRPPRPLLGTTLWSYGALLWAYLVAGEIVVWTAVPELLGVVAVLAAFSLACHRGTSQMPNASRLSRALPGVIAFFGWCFSMLAFTAVFATGRRSQAELTSLLLWFLAAISYSLGRHLVALNKVPSTDLARRGRVVLWLVTGIATLMAGANIIGHA